MTTQDTRKYWKNLAMIPWSKRGEIRTKLVPWIYTNDYGFSEVMPELVRRIKLQRRDEKLRVALLSGVGSFLNVAPYVDADLFVSVDRNSFVLDQVRKMVTDVSDSETPAEYLQIAQLETFFSDLTQMGVDPEPYWEIEKQSFGDWHFTASQDNFTRTRLTLLNTPMYCSQGNFVYEPYVQSLKHALEEVAIVYANFTDLAEWHNDFLNIVGQLPFSQDAVISWATNLVKNRPIAQISTGIVDYSQCAGVNIGQATVDYFKPFV